MLCFHAATGKRLWTHEYPVSYKGLSYANGPRAAPTVKDGHVYALGAVGHLHCLDAVSGAPVWAREDNDWRIIGVDVAAEMGVSSGIAVGIGDVVEHLTAK